MDQRKEDHLDIVLSYDVRSRLATGLERYRLVPCALPEIALEDVSTRLTFLGHTLGAPLLISPMTGGPARAQEINRRLATIAQRFGLAMGLGSQRVAMENPELLVSFQVRDVAPDIFLMANLGAVQLNHGYGPRECQRIVEAIGADALVLHLNPLQEAIQPHGDTNFRGLLAKIADLCAACSFPIIVKEVGCGISAKVARQLEAAGVAAIDIAGAGGTSWSRVESFRVTTTLEREVAAAFDDWGLPTAQALVEVRQACELPLIASGGIQNGVEIAKCLALGANLVGMARPLLQAAVISEEALQNKVEVILRQLRLALFGCGVHHVTALGREHIAERDLA